MSTPTRPNYSEEHLQFALNSQQHQGYPMIGNQNPNHLVGMLSDGSGNISVLFPTQLPLYGVHRFPMLQTEIQPAWCQAAIINSYISAGLLAPHALLPACWADGADPADSVAPSEAKLLAPTGIESLATAAEETNVNSLAGRLHRQANEVWHQKRQFTLSAIASQ